MQKRTVTTDLSEVGKTQLFIEAEIEFDHYAGCAQSYDSPSEPEWGFVRDVRTKSVCGSDWEITRKTRPDWMAFADACVGNKLESENVLRFIGHEC